MSNLKQNHGLTLIEVIAAVAILAIGLVAIMSLFPVGLKMAQNSTYTTRASVAANTLLEEIRTQVASGKNISWLESNGYKEEARTPMVEDKRFDYTLRYDVNSPPLAKMHEVILKIYWPSGAIEPTERTFITYVYVP